MGAPTVFDRLPTLSVAKMKAAYKRTGSLKRAGELLDVSKDSIRKYLHEAGIEVKPAGQAQWKGKLVPQKHTSCLAEWLKRHPKVKLPKSPKAIAFITGCSYSSVQSYLYRRKKWKMEHKNASAIIHPSTRASQGHSSQR